jgi:MFS family permease
LANHTRRFMRRLLEVDRPVPDWSEAELAAEVERHYRWNFGVNLLDVTFFWFGFSFISAGTVIPLYISKLTDSTLPIGMAAVVAQASWFLPQLLTARSVERLPRKKPVVSKLGFFVERLPVWLMVVSALVAVQQPTLALVIFLIGITWRGFGAGVIATSWQDLIAGCFPTERRGKFLGTSLFIGTVAGTASAAISAWLLGSFPFATSFALNFGFAAVFITMSWAAISLTREPARRVRGPRLSQREFIAELPLIVRDDTNFRRFLNARTLLALGGLGAGFVTVAALDKWNIPDSMVGAYTAAQLIGQAVTTPAYGYVADRRGHKLTLEIGALLSAAGFLLAWLAPGPAWYLLVFALLGATNGAVIVSGILVVLEFSRAEKRPTYAGLANTAVGMASLVAPLIGAVLAGLSYGLLFGISAGITLAGLVLLHFRVVEPRHARPAVVATTTPATGTIGQDEHHDA